MTVKPFLKWVGGKSKLMNYLLPKFPEQINDYHELFLGGGSVLIQVLLSKKVKGKVYAYDLNGALINTYKQVQNNIDNVVKFVIKLKKEFSSIKTNTLKQRGAPEVNENNYMTTREHYYYWTRNLYNNILKNSVEAAGYFIFLNKTGFRGMYRESSSGEFNIPYGLKDKKSIPGIIDETNMRKLSELIKDVNFVHSGFENSIKQIKPKDFVYLDPPYAPENESSFVGYTKDGFGIDVHKKLFEEIKKLKNIKFVMSNSCVKLVLDNFKLYNIEKIIARRAINSKNPESTAKEVVIYN
jgi:DNA adenine methylase